jgi:hypothetical protein
MEPHGRRRSEVPHNTTVESQPGQLTVPQSKALAALLCGKTITRAAEKADVDRTTVHRWLRKDWDFQAALNRGRRELQSAIEARLLHVALEAAETVSRAVQERDVRTALAVLKGLGVLSGYPPQIREDDSDRLREEADLQAQEEAWNRALRSICTP